MDVNVAKKVEECRICHDEDEDSNMEVPCSCRGSLKYAHRKCVQRWCNEKGDTVCEICQQHFKPGYTAPPPLFHCGGIPMNFRGNWEISRRDLLHPQYISAGSTNRNLPYRNFDAFSEHTSTNFMCCRIVAMIFIILVLLRHTLPFIIYGTGEYTISVVMLVMLRIIGILLPIYVMFKALTAIQRRRNRQEFPVFPLVTSYEGNELPLQPPEAHIIQVGTRLCIPSRDCIYIGRIASIFYYAKPPMNSAGEGAEVIVKWAPKSRKCCSFQEPDEVHTKTQVHRGQSVLDHLAGLLLVG